VKFFIDTEFSERGPLHPVELISVGIVGEDGRTFYGICSEYDPTTCNEWVKANVLPRLNNERADCVGTRRDLANAIRNFVGNRTPEFWGYYADYDWVVLCQLFGTMMDLPKGWPMYCRDLKQWADELGNPQLPAQTDEHNALADAWWNVKAFSFLNGLRLLEEA
jgi:hypothetical protein